MEVFHVPYIAILTTRCGCTRERAMSVNPGVEIQMALSQSPRFFGGAVDPRDITTPRPYDIRRFERARSQPPEWSQDRRAQDSRVPIVHYHEVVEPERRLWRTDMAQAPQRCLVLWSHDVHIAVREAFGHWRCLDIPYLGANGSQPTHWSPLPAIP